MNDLIEFLTSREIIVVYIVVGIAIVLYFIITFIDKTYYKRIRKQNTKELNKLVDSVNEELEEHPIVSDQVVEEVKPITNVLYVDNTKKVTPTVTVESVQAKVEQIVNNKPVTDINKVIETTTKEEPAIETLQDEDEPITTKINKINEVIAPKVVEPIKEEEVAPKVVEPVITKVVEQTSVTEPNVEVVEDTKTDLEDMICKVTNDNTQNIKKVSTPVEETLQYTDIEPNKEEAQAEIAKLTAELQEAEDITNNIDLTPFEEEQEKNAIISLDELLAKSKVMYQENETREIVDDDNVPISINEIEERMKAQENEALPIIEPIIEDTEIKEPIQEKLVLDTFKEVDKPVYTENKKFKSSPVISPIFGIEDNSVKDIELENTANYEKLDAEIKKTNEFLMTLRELQKKLD